jgi:phenylpyruvate tautomerase PptA (4-oxalocrotonate tautomerase family)
MKGFLSVTILTVVFTVFLSGCFEDDVADITVINTSDHEVKDITLSYSDTNGKQTKRIAVLQRNEKKVITVIVQEKAAQDYTVGVKIEYYIDGTKFDINNLEGVRHDVNGNPYSNESFIGGGNNLVFRIKNESYTVSKK